MAQRPLDRSRAAPRAASSTPCSRSSPLLLRSRAPSSARAPRGRRPRACRRRARRGSREASAPLRAPRPAREALAPPCRAPARRRDPSPPPRRAARASCGASGDAAGRRAGRSPKSHVFIDERASNSASRRCTTRKISWTTSSTALESTPRRLTLRQTNGKCSPYTSSKRGWSVTVAWRISGRLARVSTSDDASEASGTSGEWPGTRGSVTRSVARRRGRRGR